MLISYLRCLDVIFQSSSATTPRSRRARSTDTRTKIRNDANDTIFKETLATKPFARGRSTEVRKSPSSKEKGLLSW